MKEEGFAPPVMMLVSARAALPVLVSVKDCVAEDTPTFVEAKVKLVGEKLAAGPFAPVPLRVRVCGELGAVSLKVRVAENVPAAVGTKV